MKHINYILLAAAALALAACTVEIVPKETLLKGQEKEGRTSFSAFIEGENVSESKAVLDLNGSSKPQNFWEDGDAINVFTSADADGDGKVTGSGYQFSTTLGANATSAEFAYAGAFTVGKTFAIYPYRSHSRGVNYSGSDGTYRMAGVKIPESQTLVAGSFDKMAGVMVAYAESGTSLEFKNAVALLKFQVADSNIKGGRIMVDEGDAIAGTFRADVNTSTYDLSLETYSGATTYSYVNFTIDGSTNLSTGTDYYVAVRPTALTSDLKIYLNGMLVKTINTSKLASINRNKIYNLGTLSVPGTPAEIVLPFDFSGAALSGWPTSDNWKSAPGELDCVYPLYGTDRHFFLTDCGNASKARVAWVSGSGGLILYTTWRYVGLPAIPGYKLVKVTGTMCLSTKDTRKAAIVTNVAADNTLGKITDLHTFVTGGEQMVWSTKGSTYSFDLSGTEANTMYYFLCTNTSVGVSNLVLKYEPV